MKKFTLTEKPPAHTLIGFMDTSRKRKIVDGWLDAAMALVQRFLRGEETNEDYFSRATLIVARSIAKLDTCIRACENFNRNLQIRAHVITSAAGRAWARRVLGEANIKRWQARYDVGGWPDKKAASRAKAGSTAMPRKTPKSYEWKPITLPSIAYWCPFKPLNTTFPNLPDPFARPAFSWPREKRALKPAILWPDELEDDYEADHSLIYMSEAHKRAKIYAHIYYPEIGPEQNPETEHKPGPHPHPEPEYKLEPDPEPHPNNNPVPGLDPGPRAASAKPEGLALDPGSSPGTDGREGKVSEPTSKPP